MIEISSSSTDLAAGLPSLSMVQRYPRSTPRRYEETRAPVIQDFTHRRILCERLDTKLEYNHILDYGSEIQKKVKDQQEEEKQQFLRQSEEGVRHQAEIVKNNELKKLKEQLTAEHDKVVNMLLKEKEHAIKEECLKIEMQMQKLAIEQVQEERLKGEKALAQAVKQAEEIAAKEQKEACSAVRNYERKVAETFITNLVEKHTKEVGQIRKAASDDKKIAILNLKEATKVEKEEAVKAAREEEQQIATKKLEEVRKYYDGELRKLRGTIREREQEINRLSGELDKTEFLKKAVEKHLLELRDEYEAYIARTSGLNKELTEVFMAPLYLDEIEKDALAEYEKIKKNEKSKIKQ